VIVEAPAKLNLCLYVGPRSHDGPHAGLHEICSIFLPVDLVDRLEVEESAIDEVQCPGVEGPELAGRALAALRERGWGRPPLRIAVEKRIPVAAGLGGGSADAAAVLRLADGEVEGIEEIARSLGADVLSQIDPRPALVTGAGEVVEPLPEPGALGIVVVRSERHLSSAEVYAEADRLGGLRSEAELAQLREAVRAVASSGVSPLNYADLLVNDLERAAVSLLPEICDTIEALRSAGAVRALMSGSGPTVWGLFAGAGEAERVAAGIDGAIAVRPWEAPA
jgi:4-diphosphocytidyl-2-C-methyl-D-erythritol kinase